MFDVQSMSRESLDQFETDHSDKVYILVHIQFINRLMTNRVSKYTFCALCNKCWRHVLMEAVISRWIQMQTIMLTDDKQTKLIANYNSH